MEEIKTFNLRLPRAMWKFFKVYAAKHESSMNEMIKEYIEKLQKKAEKNVDEQ